ncbi:hypothetical protein B5F17_13285 [Butyricicoccus pullicaecorum]|uniref:LppX_LprAFG lipoprotein n=1 Tax=Butyricicoccus pullicaecorum TaxID=501571 RepID=A0A1Y4LBI0_9FIRM|nr:DUF6612 family protein [Butyricicoccus pullicaecorum]OUP51402.1 hypothetical protein B5F17_13285 [Butyricicoccus pullicaecorum]
MKKTKRALAALSALTLTLSLTACGGGGQQSTGDSGTDAMTPAERVAAAEEKMSALTSLSIDMTQDIGMSFAMADQSQELNMSTKMQMDVIQEPLKAKGTMQIDMGEELGGVQDVELYIMSEDDTANVYMQMGGQWIKQSVTEAELGQYDAADSLELYLDSAADFAEAGTEQVGGADATKFTGVIKGDKLYDVIEESGVLSSLGQTGTDVSEDAIKSMLSELGDLPMSVWINADGYPVQYEMDMSQMIDSIVQNALEAEGAADQGMTMTVSKAAMSLTCSNFNAVEDFELPAEAQNATAA